MGVDTTVSSGITQSLQFGPVICRISEPKQDRAIVTISVELPDYVTLRAAGRLF